jgi:hypothetical protein
MVPSGGEYDTEKVWLSVISLSSTLGWKTEDPIVTPSKTDTVWGRFLSKGEELISERKTETQKWFLISLFPHNNFYAPVIS